MLKSARIFAPALVCGLLISCSTMKPAKDDDTEMRIKTSKINTQLGIAYLERHNIQRAKQKLLMALDQAPETPEPWYAMGYFLEATGNKADARTYYLRSVEIAPTRGDVQNNYGTFLCRTGDYKAAIQHFMLATKDKDYLDPADAYENAGMCALKMPNYRLARKYLTSALAEDPSRPNALIGLAELDYQIGNYQAASRQLSAYLLMSPATAQSNYLGTRIQTKLAALKPAPAAAPVAVAIADPEPEPVRPVARVTYTQLLKQTAAKKPAAAIHEKLAANTKPVTPAKQIKAIKVDKPALLAAKKADVIKKHSASNKVMVMNAIKKLPATKKPPTLAAKKGKIERV